MINRKLNYGVKVCDTVTVSRQRETFYIFKKDGTIIDTGEEFFLRASKQVEEGDILSKGLYTFINGKWEMRTCALCGMAIYNRNTFLYTDEILGVETLVHRGCANNEKLIKGHNEELQYFNYGDN